MLEVVTGLMLNVITTRAGLRTVSILVAVGSTSGSSPRELAGPCWMFTRCRSHSRPFSIAMRLMRSMIRSITVPGLGREQVRSRPAESNRAVGCLAIAYGPPARVCQLSTDTKSPARQVQYTTSLPMPESIANCQLPVAAAHAVVASSTVRQPREAGKRSGWLMLLDPI